MFTVKHKPDIKSETANVRAEGYVIILRERKRAVPILKMVIFVVMS